MSEEWLKLLQEERIEREKLNEKIKALEERFENYRIINNRDIEKLKNK